MIVTLTPNPAVDVTYRVGALEVGASHPVGAVREQAGGKGVNTAAVLTTMGQECVAVCPVGADDADRFAADLDARGVRHRLLRLPGRTRRSVTVVDDAGEATVLNEPGLPWGRDDRDLVIQVVAQSLSGARVLTISGSVPDAAVEAVVRCVETADALAVPAVLDLRGPVLRDSLAHGPALVKPNRAEAAAMLGFDAAAAPSAAELAERLVGDGAGAAVVSDGAAGLTLVSGDGVRLVGRLPEPLQGNATGAGDALTAALAAGLAEGVPTGRDAWAETLRTGVAWSAAAVLQPVAGAVDPADIARLLPRVEIEEIA